ncbi:MAG: hypothetical protein DHS20C08_06200 [Rhodomicrobium sp.]|nr:MAG: hypothetical protein DHS20C08_06200 [Rhodomicrobium sp.]
MKLKKVLKTLALIGLMSSAGMTAPAQAADDACLAELKTLMKTFDSQIPNSRVRTTLERDGKILQEQSGAYLDAKNFINESLRHNYWTMVRGNDEYRSRDGKVWQKFKTRTEGWSEKASAYGAKIITEISNGKCGMTEELDGKSYKVYTYTHIATDPAPIHTENKIYIEPKSGWRYRWISTLTDSKPHTILTNVFTKDNNITLPDPEKRPEQKPAN